MEEEAADGEAEEVFDKGSRVFVEALDHDVVLQTGDHGKVEWQEGKDGLEDAFGEPKGAEGCQHEDDGDND